MTITNEQAAYIAGLFDGEGSIYFAKRPEKKKKHSRCTKQRNPIAQSKAFQEFLAATRGITNSELTEVSTNQLLVQYNVE